MELMFAFNLVLLKLNFSFDKSLTFFILFFYLEHFAVFCCQTNITIKPRQVIFIQQARVLNLR